MPTLPIAVHYQGNTYNARIIIPGNAKFTASCTGGPDMAVRAVARKFYGAAPAATVRKYDPTTSPCRAAVDAFNVNPARKTVFDFFEFDA